MKRLSKISAGLAALAFAGLMSCKNAATDHNDGSEAAADTSSMTTSGDAEVNTSPGSNTDATLNNGPSGSSMPGDTTSDTGDGTTGTTSGEGQ